MSSQSKNLRRAGNPWIIFVGVFITIGITLISRHCYPNPKVVEQSQHQYWKRVNLNSTRGIIQDVKGNALVISDTLPAFAIDPSMVSADELEKLSGLVSEDIIAKVRRAMNTKNRFVWLNHKVPEEEAKKFKTLMREMRASREIDEPYRKYTNQK
ncbi:MAG: hypothetical protein IJP97_07740, partial [Synergistaceae bacterium]|nr:hypothetical protein [Synergistaceae bacterium]